MTGRPSSSPIRSRVSGFPLRATRTIIRDCSHRRRWTFIEQSANVRKGHEWDKFEGLSVAQAELERFLAEVPFNKRGRRRYEAPLLPVPATLATPKQASMSTQQGFGLILSELARSSEPLADRIVTTSPDVTVSTNLGGWVNRRGLFARDEMKDLFKSERIPSTFTWDFGPKGQHLELGIAEMNLFILLSALGPLPFPVRRAAPARSARSTTRSSRAGSMPSITPATRMPASSSSRRPRA